MNKKVEIIMFISFSLGLWIMLSCDSTHKKGSYSKDKIFEIKEDSNKRSIEIMEPYEVKNEDYFLRIEQKNDGNLILKCWYGGQKDGEPDFILNNGKRIFWDEMANYYEYNDSLIIQDCYFPLGERYLFKNDEEEYRYNNGWHKGSTLHELIIYNGDGDIIYAKDFDNVSKF